MQSFLVSQQLDRRAAQILRSVRAGKVSPNSDALAELAEINEALSDQPVKPVIVARMTITRSNGIKVIVEVEAGSKFATFFKFYKQVGARRSTKTFLRHGCRNEAGMRNPRLELIADRISLVQCQDNPVTDVKIQIFKKRLFRRAMTVSPDQLGLTKTAPLPIYRPVPVARSFSPSGSLGGN